MDKDLEQLKLLSIFHYVLGGITALFACFPLIHVAVGVMFMVMPNQMHNGQQDPFPQHLFGLFFIVLGGTFVLLGWTLAISLILAGKYLKSCQRYTFCLVVAGFSCLMMPFGTILGVFTIVTLMKDSVKQLFSGTPQSVPLQSWK